MTDLLHLDGLVKRFGGLTATDGVTLDVTEGEIHALIGPNGAGKTTLIHQIAGSLAPDAGRITFNGIDVTRMSLHLRTQLGLARSYQVVSLFRRLSVRDNLAFAVQARTGSTFRFWRSAADQQPIFDEARELAGRVDLADRFDTPALTLAHGEQRRLEIGLALATRPKLLLLDEPAAGIPTAESADLFEVIARLPADVTILFIEHDMDLVFRFAARITVLVGGRILTEGTPAEIAADPRVKEVYLGEAQHG